MDRGSEQTVVRVKAALAGTVVLLGLLAAAMPGWGQQSEFDTTVSAAAAARGQGDMAGAMQLYQHAVELNPQWSEGWWFLGTMRYGADQYGPAREALTHFVGLMPSAGPALALRGLCEFEMELFPEALQDIEQGISLGAANQPKNAQIILYHEALLLTRLGKFEEAVPKYQFLVKQGGGSQEELIQAVGLTGLRQAKLPKEMDPAQRELVEMVGRAGATVMQEQMDAGEQGFAQVFARYPAEANVHYFYGYLLFAAHPDQAAAEFHKELAVAPHSAIAHAMCAWAAGLQGDFPSALKDGEKAAAEDPSLPLGQLVYGRALVETGSVDAGLPHLVSALQMEPGNLEAHLTLAKAYSKMGRSEDARRERLLCLTMTEEGTGKLATP